MPQASPPSPARPAVALGLTFLIVGLTFALPVRLLPQTETNLWTGPISPEVANVYACVAWAGWAHFIYAFRGQGSALARTQNELGTEKIIAYALCVTVLLLLLLGLRSIVGVSLFGALVWVYFIDHFLKAEQMFEGKGLKLGSVWARWSTSFQPVIAFSWLSIVLLNVGQVNSLPWVRLGVSLGLACLLLALGGWKKLASGEDLRGPLLTMFFIGEALVWGTFSRYGGPIFLTGVYVFHVAAGSYFHYLGSYLVGNARSGLKDKLLHPLAILGVNLGVIALGFFVARSEELKWLTPVLGVQWFTLWVGLHLVSSDVFPFVKRWKN